MAKRKKKIAGKKESAENSKADKIIDIYTDLNEDAKVDMTKLERKTSNKKKKVLFFSILFLFIIAGASLAGFFVFNGKFENRTKAKAEITIKSVDAMASGEKIELEIIYENKEDVSIKSGTVSLHYPEGFYFQSASPQPNANNNTWNIANVPAQTSGKITITGQLVGELNESKEFTAFLTYQPINFNSDFQDTEKKTVKINDTIVTFETKLPEKARTGEEIEYSIKLKNTASLALPNAKAQLTYPKQFTPTTADPTASTGNSIWQFEQIEAGEEKEILVKGTIKGNSKETAEFKFQLGLEEPNGFFNVQAEKMDSLTIINPDLSLKITAPEYAETGASIEYSVDVENTSDVEIKNLEIGLDFSEGVFDQKSAVLEKINELKPQDKKTLKFNANIKKKIDGNISTVKATAKIISAQIAKEKINFDKTAEVETKLKASFQFTSRARYYDDDLTKLGSGPIPPKVGEKTSYVLWWDIKAKGGDLKNIEITANVPDYIKNVEINADGAAFDAKTNQIKWTISNLANDETKRAIFTVSAVPAKEQINKLLILVKEAIVSAVDVNTGESLTYTADKITSDLAGDPAANGKGVVVE